MIHLRRRFFFPVGVPINFVLTPPPFILSRSSLSSLPPLPVSLPAALPILTQFAFSIEREMIFSPLQMNFFPCPPVFVMFENVFYSRPPHFPKLIQRLDSLLLPPFFFSLPSCGPRLHRRPVKDLSVNTTFLFFFLSVSHRSRLSPRLNALPFPRHSISAAGSVGLHCLAFFC